MIANTFCLETRDVSKISAPNVCKAHGQTRFKKKLIEEIPENLFYYI